MKTLTLLFWSWLLAAPLLGADQLVSDRLIKAIIQVESAGRDTAIGDHGKAYGALQVRQAAVSDINRVFKTSYALPDMLVRTNGIDACRKYLSIYATPKRLGREPTSEDLSRIWNGGQHGWKKKATQKYWAKIKRQL